MTNAGDVTIALCLLDDKAAAVATAEDERTHAEQHLFWVLRTLRKAGGIDDVGLYETYLKYRQNARPGYGRRWAAAGLPTRQKLLWATSKSVTPRDDT